MKNQSGQVVIILLMLMLVALSVGLAVTQKSITDVTTSTQTEQSSRAFSAAEAGIEKALTGGAITGTAYPLGNDATAKVDSSALLPVPGGGVYEAIEYPPIGRETTAQFWLIDPAAANMGSAAVYGGTSFDLYFGNPGITTDQPAIEIKVVMVDNGVYKTQVNYYDSITRITANNFSTVPASCRSTVNERLNSTILGSNRDFLCKTNVPIKIPGTSTDCINGANCKVMFIRARFLYSEENQKLAIAPVGNYDFPPQIQIYNATGISGQSEKQIQAFKVKDIVPAWFDFAVFSVNEIRK